jgi:hypothetical protein
MNFMNCCGDHENDGAKKKSHSKSRLSHMWMMLLCCGAPVILLGVISLLGTGFPEVRAVLTNILPYVCPIFMIAMIPMMLRHGKHDGDSKDEKRNAATTEEKR